MYVAGAVVLRKHLLGEVRLSLSWVGLTERQQAASQDLQHAPVLPWPCALVKTKNITAAWG
jgi:hypothetical protein